MTVSKSDTILILLGLKEYVDLGLVKLTLMTKSSKRKKILIFQRRGDVQDSYLTKVNSTVELVVYPTRTFLVVL